MPGGIHDAGHGLHDQVVGRALGERAVLAEPGQGSVNQLRVYLFESVPVDAQTGSYARPVIFDQDVGFTHQVHESRLVALVLQVHGDGPFVPVQNREVHGFLVLERAKAARVIAARGLDFHYVCTQVCQLGRAIRAC